MVTVAVRQISQDRSMDSTIEESDKLSIGGSWLIPAERDSVYAVASDFARMPENFPKIAHSTKILTRDGNRLTIQAEAASFGRLFPRVNVSIDAELIPGRGYRCSTFNRTFNTRGEEQLLLNDAEGGTQIEYTYVVTVKRRWLRQLYGWLVRTFGVRYWKRCYLTPLTKHAQEHQRALLANNPLHTEPRSRAG